MDRLCVGDFGSTDDGGDVQVTAGAFRWTDANSLVGKTGVQAVAVGFGVRAVAAGHSLIQIASIPLELYLLWHVARLRPSEYLRRLARPLLTSVVMGVCVYATYLAVHSLMGPVLCLTLLVAEGVVIYLALWRVLRREYVPGLWRLLVGRA